MSTCGRAVAKATGLRRTVAIDVGTWGPPLRRRRPPPFPLCGRRFALAPSSRAISLEEAAFEAREGAASAAIAASIRIALCCSGPLCQELSRAPPSDSMRGRAHIVGGSCIPMPVRKVTRQCSALGAEVPPPGARARARATHVLGCARRFKVPRAPLLRCCWAADRRPLPYFRVWGEEGRRAIGAAAARVSTWGSAFFFCSETALGPGKKKKKSTH